MKIGLSHEMGLIDTPPFQSQVFFDKLLSQLLKFKIISIFHVCKVWIEKSVTRLTDLHHEACRVIPNSDPE